MNDPQVNEISQTIPPQRCIMCGGEKVNGVCLSCSMKVTADPVGRITQLETQLAAKDAEIERLNKKIQRVLALPSFVEPTPQTVLAKNILAEEQIGNCDSPFVHGDSFKPQMELLKECLGLLNHVNYRIGAEITQLLARAEALGVGKEPS